MKRLLFLAALCNFGQALFAQTQFSTFCQCDGWTRWSPHEDLAPASSVAEMEGRSGGNALKIETKSVAEFGAWKLVVNGLKPLRTYRLTLWYRCSNVPQEKRSVAPRLEWLDAAGKSLRPPEFGLATAEQSGWKRVEDREPFTGKGSQRGGRTWFRICRECVRLVRRFQIVEETSPPDRIVNAVTVFHRPRHTKSAMESVEQFCQLAATAKKADLVCLPEGITVVGTGKSYYEVGESVPGPTTARLGVGPGTEQLRRRWPLRTREEAAL